MFYDIYVSVGNAKIPCDTLEEAEALVEKIECDDGVLINFRQAA